MRTLVLITARAGSKRVPGKNTRLLHGKPLIYYSIQHAKSLQDVQCIALSTDDSAAAEVARSEGILVIDRPVQLATDDATTLDVVIHSLDYLDSIKKNFDFVILLQPTVPIREQSVLNDALRILKTSGCDSVTSHYKLDTCHPNRLKRLDGKKLLPYDDIEIQNIPRSELPAVYCRDGSIYAFRSEVPYKYNSLVGVDQCAVISNEGYCVNIDTEKDWIIAEALMKYHGQYLIKE